MVCVGSVLVFDLVCIILDLTSFAITLTKKRVRELVALLILSFVCIVTVNVLQLFLSVPEVGLQFMIVVFSVVLME